METKVLIALITGGFSLLVAFISLLGTVLNSRSSRRTAQSLEVLKYQFAESSKTAQIADEALRHAVGAIQKVKDEILLVLNSYRDSLTSEEALQRLVAAREEVFSAYQSDHGSLDERERRVFHRAKDAALQPERVLRDSIGHTTYASELPPQDIQRLSDIRNLLTDVQQVLRDYRTDRIMATRTMR